MFIFETPHLDLEIYRLVSILEASTALAEFEGSESDKRNMQSLRNWERPEVSRIVISLAAIIRSSLDAYSYGADPALERPVGTLFPDEGNPQIRKPLLFRDACNKVLHYDHVDFKTTPEPPPVPSGTPEPLTGHLTLYGRLPGNGKEWRAELDLRQFALSALALNP